MLSILIPSIPERAEKLERLLTELYKQIDAVNKAHPSLGEVEVLFDDSKKFSEGGLSIGEKRNSLTQRANFKYLCFLDDDDKPSPDYVETLLRLCHEDKDVCTFKSLFTCDDYWTVIDMSISYLNEQSSPDREVRRNAWHICPVRSELAKQVRFSNLNHNEDWTWMDRVLDLVKTEAKSNRIIHNYTHYKSVSEADRIYKKPVILCYSSKGREDYNKGMLRLIDSVKANWNGDFIGWSPDIETREYNGVTIRNCDGVPQAKAFTVESHKENPYQFKLACIQIAREEGYQQIIWLDSSLELVKDPTELFAESPVIAFDNLGHPLYKYISDQAIENLNLSVPELMEIPQTWGGAIGFDFSNPKAETIFNELLEQSQIGSFKNGTSCYAGHIAHRHDQAVMSVLFHRHGIKLQPYGKIVTHPHDKEPFEYGTDFYIKHKGI